MFFGSFQVLADTDSNLSMWDLNTKTSGHINTGRGWIRKVRFAPGRDNLKLLVLFSDGADVWDMKDVSRVGQTKGEGSNRVLDGDWAASDRPLLATADGCIRVMDVTLTLSSSPMPHYCSEEAVGSPYLLSTEASLNLRTILTHQPWRSRYSLTFTEEDGFTAQHLKIIHTWLDKMPAALQKFLLECKSTGHRALVTACLFGDQSELRFWTVAMHYIPKMTAESSDQQVSNSSDSSAELISFPDAKPLPDARLGDAKPLPDARLGDTNVTACVEPLGAVYSLFCDSPDFRKSELERLSLQESKLVTGEQKARLCRHLSLLGEYFCAQDALCYLLILSFEWKFLIFFSKKNVEIEFWLVLKCLLFLQ